MKSILIAACLLPLYSLAQDCKVLRETDPYTKLTRLSSGFIQLQGATVAVDSDSKELDFFFVVDGKCFDNSSTMVVFFDGVRAKSTYRNTGSMNCDGYFHFVAKNGQATPTPVQKLMTQKIAQLVFTDKDKKEVVITLQPSQQEQLLQSAACVVNEAKSLIK
jgi:hypothetical protein